MTAGGARPIVVIGAGIVGVSTALWLQRAGRAVVLLDRLEPGEGASYGNAGVIACSSVVPLSLPGLLPKLPGMLLKADSPLFMRWRYLFRLLPFALPFLAQCRPARATAVTKGLTPLIADAVEQHRALAKGTPAERYLVSNDYLFAYLDRRAFEADSFAWQLRRAAGFDWELLEEAALRDFEPTLGDGLTFGVRLRDHATVRDPGRYVKALAEVFSAAGGRFQQSEVTGFRRDGGRLQAVETRDGPIACAGAVIACGAWSKALTAGFGVKTPLESERGYHLEFIAASPVPRCAVSVTTGKFVATPMEGRLRCAGVVEFGGLDAGPSPAPFELLRKQFKRSFPGIAYDDVVEWMGHRPSPVDSLPYLGAVPGVEGAYCAFGHHHVGLTGGPKSGRLIADLIAGTRMNIDMAPYRVGRFQGSASGDAG